MPTYEYECQKCGSVFERFQSMSDAPVKTCPECRGRKVKRLIGTGAGLLFKGAGFYTTDYRSEGYKQAAKAETKTSSAAPEPSKAGKKTAAKDAGTGKKAS